jgi:hypothetical protein
MIIKVLLIGAALGFGVLLLRERVPGQHLLLRRAAGLAVVVGGIIAVLWPDTTVVVANAVGVGRGTDLVFYISVMAFLYYAVATSQRIHRLEHHVVELTRALALDRVQHPDQSDEDQPGSPPQGAV